MGKPLKNVHPDESRIISYIEGALSDGERRELDAHVARCDDCAKSLSSLEKIVHALHRAPDPNFKQSLRRKIHADMLRTRPGPDAEPTGSRAEPTGSPRPIARRRASRIPRIVLGVAASLLVAAFGLSLLLGSQSSLPVRMFGGGSFPQHAATVHISTDDPEAFVAETNNLAALFQQVAVEITPGTDPSSAAGTSIVLSGTIGHVGPFADRLRQHGTGRDALELEGERHHPARLEIILR